MALDQTLSQQLDIDNEIEVAGEHFVLCSWRPEAAKGGKINFQPASAECTKKSHLTNIILGYQN